MRKADTNIEKTQKALIKINVIMGLFAFILGVWGTSNPVKAEEIIQITDHLPAIVSINTKTVSEVQEYYDAHGFNLAQNTETIGQELGESCSGIIIKKTDTELLIATNYTIIGEAIDITVTFADGESCEGSEKGSDEERDLAIVAVSLTDISESTLESIEIAKAGSFDDIREGEQVIAIGNALGYGQSVTTGIVSAKSRKNEDAVCTCDTTMNLIQTDAEIHSGNNGGALLNMSGEVIGMNSIKSSVSGVNEMGYAISISDVMEFLETQMSEENETEITDGSHGSLGLYGCTVGAEGTALYGMPSGVYVQSVNTDGAADLAGIKVNYIITGFDGTSIMSIEQLTELLSLYEPGEEIEVDVQYQDDGEYAADTLTVILGDNTDEEFFDSSVTQG